MTKNMMDKRRHSNVGIASIILGIIGLLMIFLPGIINSFLLFTYIHLVSVNFLFIFSSLCLGIISIITGGKAKKQGDMYGKYGMALGKITIILGSVEVAFIVVFFSGVFFL